MKNLCRNLLVLFACLFMFLEPAKSINSDSLTKTKPIVDTMVVDTVSHILIVVDSIKELENDSTRISLVEPVKDSTALIMDQVKSITDMISMKSALNNVLVENIFSDTAIVNKYNRRLDALINDYEKDVAAITGDSVAVNPVFFRLFAPLTLYSSPITDAMRLDTLVVRPRGLETIQHDANLLHELDRVLLYTYLNNPEMVKMTEESLRKNISAEALIKDKTSETKIALDIPSPTVAVVDNGGISSPTEVVVAKPNFWVTKGSFSSQMTETYFSPNWYKGGTNNINVLSSMTIEANYDDKKKTTWKNKLETRIGFYKNQDADIEANEDLLRITSQLNLKAIRNWNYAVQAQGYTQMMQNFKEVDGKEVLKSRFMAPAYASLSVGMDYSKKFKNGNLSVFVGPLTYNNRFCVVKDLATSFGIEEGKRLRQDVGSKFEINFNYKISKNISYKSRLYYYTSYEYVQSDWENTINIQVSKYLSASMFLHPRFDDSLEKPNAKWGFFQFKQYMMFGLNYTW
ncbi:MAG: DUF3078 domain-containing protein [Bacteroidales bacterium]|nr:DUF3078 domain-containing protein [Bacteroidales bacterium]